MQRSPVSLAVGLALIAIVVVGVVAAATWDATTGRSAADRPPVQNAGDPAATGGAGTAVAAAIRRDGPALQRALAGSDRLVAGLAREPTTLPRLVTHAREVTAGVRAQEDAVDAALRLLPGTLRHSRTSMAALRQTLDDLDPLVAAAGPATAGLAPLLRRLRALARTGTPAITELRAVVRGPGANDDLTDLLRRAPGVADATVPALEHVAGAARDSRPIAAFLRPVVPEALRALGALTRASSAFDANGHAVRVDALVPAASLTTDPVATAP